ncbi:tumor necrosis factor receptor superfamily member 14-like [Enoplosus armatus]|uniref:tumor necrosis factor receptor superfamily member 14-like n=1 Tax=Enoplosus armatus TaxID=215367 RepID=UPI003996ABA7
MKTVILPYRMMFGRRPLTAAPLLILVMNIFRGLSLTCHRAEYQIGNECCPMCPAGSRVKTHCTMFRSTSCLPCSEGTFMNLPTGRTQCFTCTNCDAGSGLKINASCKATSDAVCEPLEGFYCLDPAEDGCVAAQKHTSCQPGQYISQTGTASTDTVCSDCRDGTYSDGTFTSCQPHKQCESMNLLIKPGTASTDAECGEQSSDRNVITTVVVVVVVLVLVIAASVYVVVLRKKKGCLKTKIKEEETDCSKQMLPAAGCDVSPMNMPTGGIAENVLEFS